MYMSIYLIGKSPHLINCLIAIFVWVNILEFRSNESNWILFQAIPRAHPPTHTHTHAQTYHIII